MKHRIFTLFLALIACAGTLSAWDYERVLIGNLYYNLNASQLTAEVASNNIGQSSGNINITIPSSVEYESVIYNVIGITGGAFYACSVTNIEIPNSITYIGGQAFAFCQGLTSIEIPSSVTNIGGQAFESDHSLTQIIVAVDNLNYCSIDGVVFTKDTTTLIFYPAGKQGNYTIPNGVINIQSMAFWECSLLTGVTIPNSVTSIGERAFKACNSLTSIDIPNSVISIESGALTGCSNLTAINIAENNQLYSSVDGVLFNKNKTILMQYPRGKTGNYTIPNSVTNIGGYAFGQCDGLTSLNIPNNVISIDASAFDGCGNLISVTIGDGVTSIGTKAFAYCTSLTSVTIGNSVTCIEDNAFQCCYSLPSMSIPNNVTSIGGSAFQYCYGLTSVEIPNSVISIGEAPFQECLNLTSITVAADNPNYISEEGVLFDKDKDTLIQYPLGNTRKSYIIPNTITRIGDFVFFGCNSLTSVTIPNGVTSIGRHAFSCRNLTSLICEAVNPPTLGGSFGHQDKSVPLYVPYQSVDLYKAADQWNEFTNILSLNDLFNPEDPQNPGSYRLTLIAEPANMGTVTGDGLYAQGTEVEISATPNMGHHFVNWSDDNTSATRTVTLLRDTAFTANFAVNYYDVTFKDYNGVILQQTELAYGTLPIYEGSTPVRSDSALYTFTFQGWSPVIDTVREAAVYTAVYDSIYWGLDTVIISGNKDIAELSAGALTHLIVEQRGHLIVSEPRNIYSLTLHMDSTAAQVTNIANLTAENVEMVVHMPENTDSVQWYAFAAPFEVAVANGIWKNEASEPAISGMHFVIDKYDGALRASDQDGWKRLAATDTLSPGNLYMIAAYETPQAWRFIAAHPESLSELNSINISAYPSSSGEHHAGWNAISNTLWTNASASMNGVDYITTYNNQYGVYEVELIAGHDFLPAEPFFVQTPANGSILFSHSSAPAHIAPLQMALTSAETAVYTLGLTAVKSGYTDKAYITLNKSKEDAYIIGRDLEKMQRRSSSVPQLWIDAYNLHLAAQEVAFTDSMASVALGLYVPVAGIYMLSIQDVPENTNVYLTLDGNVLSKLSLNTVELNLDEGENNRYGLYICNRSNTPEGIDDISSDSIVPQKVMIDGQIFILRGEKVYTVTGQEVR